MARTPDPARKPALLAQTLEYLLDKPLATLTFRTLATALDVSTFTLVYHFGTRAELIREVLRAISERATFMERRLVDDVTLDTYFENLQLSWEWTLDPRNRQLQRLEFEAAMLESLQPDEYTFARRGARVLAAHRPRSARRVRAERSGCRGRVEAARGHRARHPVRPRAQR